MYLVTFQMSLYLGLSQLPLLLGLIVFKEEICTSFLIISSCWNFLLMDDFVPEAENKEDKVWDTIPEWDMVSQRVLKRYSPREEIFEGPADWEPGPTDLHCLQHPRIPQLVQDDLGVKLIWILPGKNQGLFNICLIPLWIWGCIYDKWQRCETDTDLVHVGLNAADEERVRNAQSGHKSMEGVLKS